MLKSVRSPHQNNLTLPSVPEVVLQLRSLLQQIESTGLHDIAAVVESDMALCTQVIKLANGSRYSSGTVVLTVPQAIKRVGVLNLERLVMASALESRLSKNLSQSARKLLNQCTAFARMCATVSAQLPEQDRLLDPASAYCLGLFSESGYVLQIVSDGPTEEHPASVLHQCADTTKELSYHCHISYVLARHWGLPQSWAQALRHHHVPFSEVAKNHSPEITGLVKLLQVAKLFLAEKEAVHEQSA